MQETTDYKKMAGGTARAWRNRYPGKRRPPISAAVCALFFLLVSIANATDAPLADFGDAPDGVDAGYGTPSSGVIGNFPTSFATSNSRWGMPGLHILDSASAHLGNLQSMEIDASDPDDPDLVENFIDDDFDDGLQGSACPDEAAGGIRADAVPVTLSLAATGSGTLYLNVLIDMNHDGVWSNPLPNSGLPEWVVRDHPVSPGQITTPSFLIPLAFSPAWARISLTDAPVSDTFADDGTGWDGSGTFLRGEVEDYKLGHQLASAWAAAEAAAEAEASAFAAAGAFAFATASAQSLSASSASVTTQANAWSFAWAEVQAWAQAAAEAHARAVAWADATQSANAEAGAYAFAAVTACANAEAQAAAVAASCASCACASACSEASAAAAAAAEACAAASASAQANANAASSASSSAVAAAGSSAAAAAESSAAAAAYATASAAALAHAEAFALAVAEAEAFAFAASTAAASASSHASASAEAAAAAKAAACAGDQSGSSAASAQAVAAARAAASAQAIAVAAAEAAAGASAATLTRTVVGAEAYVAVATSVSASAQAAASAAATADAWAGAAAVAEASASAAASAGAFASAAASSSASAIVAVSSSSSASCSGDCCTNPDPQQPEVCYKAKGRTLAAGERLAVEDEFGAMVAEIKKPAMYCVRADVEGVTPGVPGDPPIPQPVDLSTTQYSDPTAPHNGTASTGSRQCYQIRERGKRPSVKAATIAAENGIALDSLQLRSAHMLCLPTTDATTP